MAAEQAEKDEAEQAAEAAKQLQVDEAKAREHEHERERERERERAAQLRRASTDMVMGGGYERRGGSIMTASEMQMQSERARRRQERAPFVLRQLNATHESKDGPVRSSPPLARSHASRPFDPSTPTPHPCSPFLRPPRPPKLNPRAILRAARVCHQRHPHLV